MTLGELRKNYERSLWKKRNPQTQEEITQIRKDSFEYVDNIAKEVKISPYDSK